MIREMVSAVASGAPVPGVAPAVKMGEAFLRLCSLVDSYIAALIIYEAVDKVKVCRVCNCFTIIVGRLARPCFQRQCKDLGERCKNLSLTLQESSEGMVGTNVMEVVDVTYESVSSRIDAALCSHLSLVHCPAFIPA
jgi:hypothetical protein